MPRVRGHVAATVVFVQVAGIEPDLVETTLRKQAEHLPDTHVMNDVNDEMTRFGAKTSGAVLLYDIAGELRFSGGLTSERGHEGSSLGQEQIFALVTTGRIDHPNSPVFGCELSEKEEP
jgi:hypothetical protein